MDMGLGGLQELVMGQGGLASCGSWGCKESDTTERLNWTEKHAKTEDIKIAKIEDINHSIKAFNSFLRTSPAIVPARCFRKCRKRTHSKEIYKKVQDKT